VLIESPGKRRVLFLIVGEKLGLTENQVFNAYNASPVEDKSMNESHHVENIPEGK
jgi:hypothetical protein